MKLADLIADLEIVDDTLCIVARRPWSGVASAKVVQLTDDFRIPDEVLAAEYEYFLEVSVAREEVLGDLASKLTAEQRVEAILFYAENDAYPDWLCEMRD